MASYGLGHASGPTVRVERTWAGHVLCMFASSVTAWLNWTATRVQIALTCDDDEQRALAARNVTALLNDPVSLPQLERLVELLSS